MILDNNLDGYGPVLITDSVGTARMDIADGQLVWRNDRFGDWLVCKNKKGGFDLQYWDVIANQQTDLTRCAKVQLLTEDVR